MQPNWQESISCNLNFDLDLRRDLDFVLVNWDVVRTQTRVYELQYPWRPDIRYPVVGFRRGVKPTVTFPTSVRVASATRWWGSGSRFGVGGGRGRRHPTSDAVVPPPPTSLNSTQQQLGR